ncbi:hypothetical protein ACRQ5Q_43685 (plasmid) [Bradyrhizobium sp. PMVTL-01]|uniref:hypothetical protein n=1 Tax=Bradyrhizobium sp. PMVTL-01 TaxID=3434999 RepID=UPI003F703412
MKLLFALTHETGMKLLRRANGMKPKSSLAKHFSDSREASLNHWRCKIGGADRAESIGGVILTWMIFFRIQRT